MREKNATFDEMANCVKRKREVFSKWSDFGEKDDLSQMPKMNRVEMETICQNCQKMILEV